MHFSSKKLVIRVALKALKDNILIYGGYAAFAIMLALFPFLIFLMTLAGLLGTSEALTATLDYAFTYMPAPVVEAIMPIIKGIFSNESPGLLTAAAIGTVWIAASGVEGLRFGLNNVYGVHEFRPFIRRRLESALIVLAGAAAFFLITPLVVIWPLINEALASWLGVSTPVVMVLALLRLVIATIVLMGLFSILYRVLPNRHIQRHGVKRGALMAALLWLVLARLFALYLEYFGNYDATYGSIGGIIITLVFFQFSATVILLGAVLNAVLETPEDGTDSASNNPASSSALRHSPGRRFRFRPKNVG